MLSDDKRKSLWLEFNVDYETIYAIEAAVLEAQGKQEPVAWYDGFPPFPQDQEWFIAETTYGDRVVLKVLPEEYTYDYKTADETYIKKEKIKRWMQFPDCDFAAPVVQPDDLKDAERYRWLRDKASSSQWRQICAEAEKGATDKLVDRLIAAAKKEKK